jgi:methylmalonyl-CoA mutase
MTNLPLASEFPPASREDWLAKVERTLGEAGIDSIRLESDDGIIIEPLYEAVTGNKRFERSAPDGRWLVMQRVDHPAPAVANHMAREDLSGGATGLTLTFKGAASARGFGLAGSDARDIALTLKDVALHAVALRLEPGPHATRSSHAVREVYAARSLNPEAARLSFGIDPIGLIVSGGLMASFEDVFRQQCRLAEELATEFRGPFMEADGRPYHDGGATEAQELGIVLATALAYFRALDHKVAPDVLAPSVGVTLAVDCDLFIGIAKLRAMRLVWRNVLDACSMPAVPLALHAESSWRMMTAREASMNLLRNVAATFAAAIGGAESITVLPHSLAIGLPDEFARRMARNVQLMLLEEAQLHRVGDPASGAGYVEALTQSLAEKAWGHFQQIERHGGITAALASGYVQNLVRDAARGRMKAIAARERTFVGVNEFPDPNEEIPAVLDVVRQAMPDGGAATIPALRLSEPLESR